MPIKMRISKILNIDDTLERWCSTMRQVAAGIVSFFVVELAVMNRLVIDRFGYRIFFRLLCIFTIFTVFSSVTPLNVIGQTDNFQSYSNDNLGISLKKPFD